VTPEAAYLYYISSYGTMHSYANTKDRVHI